MDELTNIPTPTTPADAIDVSASGQITIDSLLWGTALTSETSGPSVTISYSFSGPGHIFSSDQYSGYSFGFGEPWAGISALESTQATEFESILRNFEHSINIGFQEVSETNSQVGTIRIAWTGYERPENSAWAYFPADTASAGDIWLNSDILNPDRNDLFFRSLLIHELGHALGLKHPDETRSDFPTLGFDLDGVDQTIMSYNPSSTIKDAAATDLWPQSLMALDIAALQYLYGTSTVSAGDTAYTFNTYERHYETIWDASGTDTLIFSGASHLAISLVPGTWSDVGTIVRYWDKAGNLLPETKTETLFLTEDTLIENISAGIGHDNILGNQTSNSISGNAGHDTLRGAEGNDLLQGGSGSDFIVGGSGADTMSGGTGHDQLFAGTTDTSKDYLSGGAGNDTLGGGSGNDLIIGGGVSGTPVFKDATITANDEGDDVLYGGLGDDTLIAGGWNNDIRTNLSFDYGEHISLEDEENELWGGPGNDLLIGSDGGDTLVGGSGNDLLTGEGGADTFIFNKGHGHDQIRDFDTNSDMLDVSHIVGLEIDTIAAAAELQEHNGQSGLLLVTSETSSIFLEGLTLEDLALLNFQT